MNEIYTISYDNYTPSGRWTDANPMNYKHAASYAAKMIRESSDVQYPALWHEMTVWGGSLEVVSVYEGKVSYDRELEPAEGPYIAAAIRNALAERTQRYEAETGQSVLLARLTR